MKKSNLGNLVIIALLVLNVIVWLAFPPVNDGRPQFLRQYIGEIIGANNIILMASSLFLSTRPKWAEKYFGGLDKMYQTHRRAGTAAFLLIFVHVLTVPITTTGWSLGNYLAVIAFTGIVTIVLITLAPRMPFLSALTGGDYERWKSIKRFMGIFFIIAFLHSITITSALDALVAISWTQIFFVIGTVSYLYTEVFGGWFKHRLPYVVAAVTHPNASSTEVTLRPKATAMKKHHAGQFLFVRFPGAKGLDESHPFTISSAPSEQAVRLTIKASGDFTRRVFADLKANTAAVVEGPYGMFDYRPGGQKQIWLAGGIGLTPFLSFMRDMDGRLAQDVHFFYCVRHPEELVFADELAAIARKNPSLKLRIRHTAQDGPLSADEILKAAGGDVSDHEVFMCGPIGMMMAFREKFLAAGVTAGHIHFEEFNFR